MNLIYVILGFFFVALGSIGVILPVLPTTPFLLLALAFFTKGSKRFQIWFINTKLYKNNLEDFVVDRSMTFKNKVRILSFASSMLLIAFIMVNNFHARLLIIGVVIYKYYYFTFKIATKADNEFRTN